MSVAAPGMETSSETVTRDCQDPAASISSSCADGAVITFTNTDGEVPVAFTVFRDGVEMATVDVAAGGSVTEQYALAEDETATFSVEAPGGLDPVGATLVHDCAVPSAGLAHNCEAGGVVATLFNDGGRR